MNLNLTIDRFENGKAVLKTSDNETIVWPKNKLPENIKEGSVISFSINENESDTKGNKQLAKDILNEILNTSGD